MHLLVRLPTTLAVADLMKHVKGASAHLMAQRTHANEFFKWQGGYAAFSVSLGHLTRITRSIVRQREHHAANTLIPALELAPPAVAPAAEEQPA